MIVDDSEIAVKKFKMFADKVNNEAQIVDLCKKYLKHKGIDVDNTATMNAALASQIAPPRIEKVFVGASDLIETYGRYEIDDLMIRSIQDSVEAQTQAKMHIAKLIMSEVVKSDAIKFDQYKDYNYGKLVVQGKLVVYKGNKK